MRKMYFILVVILIMSATAPIVDAKKTVNGTCGDNVAWSLDETGVLLINGKGAIDDYGSSKDQPWRSYSSDMKSVVIENGVTYIGKRAFFDCPNITSMSIPESVVEIGSGAFDLCIKLTDIYYDGPDTEWSSIKKNTNRYLTVNENINMHYNNDTKFAKMPTFSTTVPGDLIVTFREIDSPCVLVVTTMKGRKTLCTEIRNIQTDTRGVHVDIPYNSLLEATHINTYIWKDLDSMQPLCKGKTIELK